MWPRIATGHRHGTAARHACMVPAYAGLLGSMGSAFFLHTVHLLPLTVGTLLLAVGALGFRAGRRRGYGPLVLGLLATFLVLVGKFAIALPWMVYAGVSLLVGASVWNSWPVGTARVDLVQLGVQGSDHG